MDSDLIFSILSNLSLLQILLYIYICIQKHEKNITYYHSNHTYQCLPFITIQLNTTSITSNPKLCIYQSNGHRSHRKNAQRYHNFYQCSEWLLQK